MGSADALGEICSHVDLAETVLRKLVRHEDPEIDWRAKALLHRIAVSRQREAIPNALPVQYGNQTWTLSGGSIDIHILEQIRAPE